MTKKTSKQKNLCTMWQKQLQRLSIWSWKGFCKPCERTRWSFFHSVTVKFSVQCRKDYHT